MQNGNNNQVALYQSQINSLQTSLAASQQEALVARITNSVITTTTNTNVRG